MVNYIGIYMSLYEKKKKKKSQSGVKNLEEILFGRSVCANGAAVHKITQEPFLVALNSKTKNQIFCVTPLHV